MATQSQGSSQREALPVGIAGVSTTQIERTVPRVFCVTPEMAGFVQVGGLGAVSASLPRALRRSSDIRVLLPEYRQVLEHVGELVLVAHLPAFGEIRPCSIAETRAADGLVVHIVLCSELYDRPGMPYGDASGVEFADNDVRFARLGLAAAELAMRGVGAWRPSVLHLNDRPTALSAAYLAWRGAASPSLLTIHNLTHQGLFDASRRYELAIPEHAFTMHGRRVLRQAVVPQGRNYPRRPRHDRQRDLREGDRLPWIRLRARRRPGATRWPGTTFRHS